MAKIYDLPLYKLPAWTVRFIWWLSKKLPYSWTMAQILAATVPLDGSND